jgi:hypothetical protein
MRNFLPIIIFMISFTSFSQVTDTIIAGQSIRKVERHQIELSPASVWLNRGFFYGHRLKYQVRLKRSMRLELESNGTIFRALDDRASQLDDEVVPLLNQSVGLFSMDLYGRGKTVNRNKNKRYVASLRLGYHFFQHATRFSNADFWAFDSTAQTGLNSIRGFQSHSISAGVGFRTEKFKREDGKMRQVSSHKWSLDYLGSVHYQLSAYSINDDNDYNVRNIPNTYGLRKSGARFLYDYTRYLNTYFGIHFGAEAVFVPLLNDYEYNPAYFVPRGGRLVRPLFTNVRVGVSFKF